MRIANILDRKGGAVITADISFNLRSAAELMMRHHIAALVVTDGKKPAGLVSERHFVEAFARKGPRAIDTPIRELVNGSLLTVSVNETLKQAMALMTGARVRHLPVINDGNLVGIVSLGDMVKHRLEEMELESNVLRDLAITAR